MDVERYPDILPFIQSLKIIHQENSEINVKVGVGLGPFQFSYTCIIKSEPHSSIHISSHDGPFKNMLASWNFEAINEGETRISYDLNATFKNRLMEPTAGYVLAEQMPASIARFEAELKKRLDQ